MATMSNGQRIGHEKAITTLTEQRNLAREENKLYSEIHKAAQLLLLISIKVHQKELEPERLEHAMGELSLACKAHYDWRTERIKAAVSDPSSFRAGE